MKEKVYAMTNDFGKKFLNTWFKKYEIVGIECERESSNSRQEFIIVYKIPTKNGFELATAVLPMKESTNDGTCFFGGFEYFARIYATEKVGIKTRWMANGNVMWPVWYTDKEKFCEFKKVYDELKAKYNVA